MQLQWNPSVKGKYKDIRQKISRSPLAQIFLVVLIQRVVKELGEDDASHLAAGVAYYVLFSMFPLFLALLAIVGFFLSSAEAKQDLLSFIGELLPGSALFVENSLDDVIRFRGTLGMGAVVGLLWSASAVFGSINCVVNRAWDIHRDRSFLYSKLLQLSMALGIGILFLSSALATELIDALRLFAGQSTIEWLDSFTGLMLKGLVSWVIPAGLMLGIFLLMYKYIPNCRTYWRFIWPGAAVSAVLFETAKHLFVWYLGNIAVYDRVYGALASVIVLLIWAYACSFILILGAEICSEYERLQTT